MPESRKDTIEQLYGLIANEEDARVCTDISDDACREVPRNFFLILASNVLTKLGDLLISPKTVLAWLMSAIGAPALVAWLVPIRESGSLVPQMVIAAAANLFASGSGLLEASDRPPVLWPWRPASGFSRGMPQVPGSLQPSLYFPSPVDSAPYP